MVCQHDPKVLGISKAALLWQQLKLNLLVYTDISFRTWYDSKTPMLLTIPSIFFFFGIVLLFLRKKFAQAWSDRQLAGMDFADRDVEPGRPGGAAFPCRGPGSRFAGRFWAESLPGSVQPILGPAGSASGRPGSSY